SSWSPASRSACAAARPRTAGTPSWTCPATARAATATAAPAATGCTSPPTGRAARRRRADPARPPRGVTGDAADAVPTGDAGNRGYGSQPQQVMQGGREQQTPDHRKEDHQRWLG